jgi:phenylalanine dehydrogenase
LSIFEQAETHSFSTIKAANLFCEQRIESRKRRNSFFAHKKPGKWSVRS